MIENISYIQIYYKRALFANSGVYTEPPPPPPPPQQSNNVGMLVKLNSNYVLVLFGSLTLFTQDFLSSELNTNFDQDKQWALTVSPEHFLYCAVQAAYTADLVSHSVTLLHLTSVHMVAYHLLQFPKVLLQMTCKINKYQTRTFSKDSRPLSSLLHRRRPLIRKTTESLLFCSTMVKRRAVS